MDVIVQRYNHESGINRPLGVHIKNGSHYRDVMKEKGFVDFEKGQQLVEKAKQPKEYKLSDKAERLIREMNMSSRNGTIRLSDRMVDGMKDVGVRFDLAGEQPKGEKGWDNASKKR